MNNVYVRGFDGGGKDSVGDIMLKLSMGPVEFTMEFQVLDVAVSYNLLLGRPWIHAAKAIPSSMHQMLKMIKGLEFTKRSKQCLSRSFLRENAFQSDDETKYDEEAAFEEISRELKHFEGKPKANLDETEVINLGDQDNVRETKISVYLEPQIKEEIIKALFEYKDVFAWSYDDMPSLSTDLVVHKLPTDPAFPHVKQKLRKFKTDMSVKIKEEITKQLGAKVIRVT
ncbi:uncharacterized protein [Nicotiana tomentosiformis]|uniref:uncharacterized protein n=1 Tax=Nicotiana tomentosiformis TaxID=4098 RepID=UPI00388C6C54